MASSNLDIVGTWEGEIRDFSFQTLVPLRLEILGASEEGGVCGTLRWGEGPPPEAITDPSRGWPRDWPETLGLGRATAPFLRNGTTYTIFDGGVSGNELHFSIRSTELWREWCSVQTPYFHPVARWYKCMPSYSVISPPEDEGTCKLEQPSGAPIIIDSGQCEICLGQVCVCNRDECGADSASLSPSPSLAITFEGTTAAGRLADSAFADPETTDIVLHRVQ